MKVVHTVGARHLNNIKQVKAAFIPSVITMETIKNVVKTTKDKTITTQRWLKE